MDADERAAKNRALAEALGWTSKAIPAVGWRWTSRGITQVYQLIQPNGEYLRVSREHDIDAKWETEAEAWEQLPNFYGSVDAVLAVLPEVMRVDIKATEYLGDTARRYGVWLINTRGAWKYGEGSTRAIALANAALLWVHAQNAGAGEGDAP